MLNQILAKLISKYPGLPKQFLGLVAAKMATKVTEESGIDAAIAELDNAPISIQDLASQFQKEGDRRVATAEKEWKKKNPPKSETGKTEEPDALIEVTDDTPSLLKQLIESNKKLSTDLEAIKGEKSRTTIQEKLKSGKLKDVPFWENRKDIPEKDDPGEIENFETKVLAEYTEFTNKLTEKGLSVLPGPKAGTPPDPKGNGKTATKEELDTVMKDIM